MGKTLYILEVNHMSDDFTWIFPNAHPNHTLITTYFFVKLKSANMSDLIFSPSIYHVVITNMCFYTQYHIYSNCSWTPQW